MVVLEARTQLQETINAQDAGKTNTWVTLQPPFTVVLKAGEHSCRMTHANREFQVASTRASARFVRESVLFIGTQFSKLYTAVDTSARGRVGVCVVFVFKYVLGHSREL
jgi:hypothetical protein